MVLESGTYIIFWFDQKLKNYLKNMVFSFNFYTLQTGSKSILRMFNILYKGSNLKHHEKIHLELAFCHQNIILKNSHILFREKKNVGGVKKLATDFQSVLMCAFFKFSSLVSDLWRQY